MSNYKSITPRNNEKNIYQELYGYYSIKLDDVLLLNPNKNIIVGVTQIDRNIPFLQELFNKPAFITLAKTFKENDMVLVQYKSKSVVVNHKEIELSDACQKELDETYEEFSSYGGYLNEFFLASI